MAKYLVATVIALAAPKKTWTKCWPQFLTQNHKNMKKILLFIALVIAVGKVNAQQGNIVIEGTADAKYNGEYVHIYNNVLKEKHDSIIIANGKFSFTRPFKEPTRYYFYSSYEIRTKHGYAPFGILIDRPSTVKL